MTFNKGDGNNDDIEEDVNDGVNNKDDINDKDDQVNDLFCKDLNGLVQANDTNNVKVNVDDGVDRVNELATEH